MIERIWVSKKDLLSLFPEVNTMHEAFIMPILSKPELTRQEENDIKNRETARQASWLCRMLQSSAMSVEDKQEFFSSLMKDYKRVEENKLIKRDE